MIKKLVKKILSKSGYEINKIGYSSSVMKPEDYVYISSKHYNQDSLCTRHNHAFMEDPLFASSYQRAVEACDPEHILIKGGPSHQIHWRVHVATWVASLAITLDGDFVECGVDRGIFSTAIMEYLNWNSRNKHFFLFDTYNGIETAYLNEEEIKQNRAEFSDTYFYDCYEQTKRNFQTYERIHMIKGAVPDTLGEVEIGRVAYLSIDMNNAYPEIAAANHFWNKLVTGGLILLDDYAYIGYEEQKKAFDKFAQEKRVRILSLPTGQGLIVKSHSSY